MTVRQIAQLPEDPEADRLNEHYAERAVSLEQDVGAGRINIQYLPRMTVAALRVLYRAEAQRLPNQVDDRINPEGVLQGMNVLERQWQEYRKKTGGVFGRLSRAHKPVLSQDQIIQIRRMVDVGNVAREIYERETRANGLSYMEDSLAGNNNLELRPDELESLKNNLAKDPDSFPLLGNYLREIRAVEKQQYQIRFGSATEAAKRHPKDNQDASFAERTPAGAVFAGIFDGVSLSRYGDGGEAARAVSDLVREKLTSGNIHEPDVALEAANDMILERRREGVKLGETTATVVELIQSRVGFMMRFASCGDSRVYVFDGKTGRLKQLSKDHSLVQEAVDEDDVPKPGQEDYYRENRNKIIRDLGEHFSRTDLSTGGSSLEPGDLVILTTDGIHDNLTRSEIEYVIKDFLEFDAAQIA